MVLARNNSILQGAMDWPINFNQSHSQLMALLLVLYTMHNQKLNNHLALHFNIPELESMVSGLAMHCQTRETN